ncbi:MAG: MobF family relaxase [Phycisphaerales bacterium]
MLRIIPTTSSKQAQRYFSTSDYFSEGQELVGVWRGRAAAMLGLTGEIRQPDWDALCDNRDPRSGERLTARTRGMRRVGYDFSFNPPKSLSLLYALTGDECILDAFRESVGETMRDIEMDAQTRVRREGLNEDRTTGNLVWGEYIHFTSRPVDGVPDPHLHAHCYAFNATFDREESRWKAAQFARLKQDGPYFEALFHARLADRVARLGLPVERTRTGWEIAGFTKQTLDRFSRRTEEIERIADERGITDPAEKDQLGGKTRERKRKDLSMPQLRDVWASRLNDDERETLTAIAARLGKAAPARDRVAAREAAEHAIAHCLERSAVVGERRVLAEALKHAVGRASAHDVQREVAGLHMIRRERDGRMLVTSRDVLEEERRMLDFARQGRATCRSLGSPDHKFERDWLDTDQKAAVRHVLSSKDRVILVRGAAGTGKTTMMQEAVAAIEAGGKRVFTFAPSAAASRGVLQTEGFKDADTVARLLCDEKLQDAVRGQVLWIDEAGLLGSRTTARLFDLAERSGARLILAGDRAQHGSVERGGTLRLLEEEAGLPVASLRQIKRQQHAEYRRAVKSLSEGKVAEALRCLDGLGWIKEVGDENRYQAVAQAYLESARRPGDTLVISPSHAEAREVTNEIRVKLRDEKAIAKTEREVVVLRPLHLTEAERADPVSYLPGDTLVLHQNIPGHYKGERLIAGRDALPFAHPDRFSVFRPDRLLLAHGDRVRITKNSKAADGATRLSNGDIRTVESVSPEGAVTLTGGVVLPAGFGHLDYGYVTTSHSAQGRSVDRVIISQSSLSFAASSREQAYVSVSRGKHEALIFTDDKEALREAVSDGDARLTATELVTSPGLKPQRRASRPPIPVPVRILNEAGTPTPERAEHERQRA